MIKKLENNDFIDVSGGTTEEINLKANPTYNGWCIKCKKSFTVPQEKIENFNPHNNHNDFDPDEDFCTGDVVISDNEVTLKNTMNWITNNDITHIKFLL